MHVKLQTATTLLIATAAAAGLTGCAEQPAPAPPEAAAVATHHDSSLQWETDWDRALARARAENKVVMAVFSADWCIWCKRLDAATFADAEVDRMLSAGVVPIKLDLDGAGKARARELGVEAPPTLVVMNADGEEIDRILGFMPPTRFMARMRGLLQQG